VVVFQQGDAVIFNDTGLGSPTVDIIGWVSPASVDVENSAENYAFTGPGGIAGSTGLTKSGTGTLTVMNNNTYAGPTTVSNGTLLVTGSLGGTGNVTVCNGGTLGGNGIIDGPVMVQPGGTLIPGIGEHGALTINNSLILQGTAIFYIDKTGHVAASTAVVGLTTVIYGGTLVVNNITSDGTPLGIGDTFNLFSAGVYAGSFSQTTLPSLPPGLAWLNNLSLNGSISVVGNTNTGCTITNVIGTSPTGFYYLGDPGLTAPTSLAVLFPNPGGSLDWDQVFIDDCSGTNACYTFDSGSPSGFDDCDSDPVPAPFINPGEGFLFINTGLSAYDWVVSSTPVTPVLPPMNYCGCGAYSLLCEQSCSLPGTFQNITGFAPQEGAGEQIWNGTALDVFTFTGGAWTPSTPRNLAAGEAAFFLVPCPTNCISIICSSNIVVTTCSNRAPVSYLVTATDPCCTNCAESNAVPPGMMLIPEGPFTMGDAMGDGEVDNVPTVTVNVSAFCIETNLVSYSLWQSVYNWATSHGYGFANAGADKAANHPVQTVDWYDAAKWCNARSQQAGLTPVYYTDAGLTQIYTNGENYITNTETVFADWTANGYRLPTEAEWEKASRGGVSGLRFPWGDTISESQANFWGGVSGASWDLGPYGLNPTFDTGGQPDTSPVGYFAPNGYGLYDMSGNVFEWCWDWYSDILYPPGSPYLGGSDPHGPAASNTGRIVRGGSWSYNAASASCAGRTELTPYSVANDAGFRCVMGLAATNSGNCFTLVTDPPSGYDFPLGTNTVTCTVTDRCGNSNTCAFTVTVLPAANCCNACISNVLVNGDFEDEPDWGKGIMNNSGMTALTGNELPGWTIETNHAVTIHLAPDAGGSYLTITNAGGMYSANTDGEGYHGNNADFYQDFNSVSNQCYTLNFNWQSWGPQGDTSPPTQLKVSVTDTVTGNPLFIGLYSFDSPNADTAGPLHLVTANFPGAGNPLRLRIEESPQSGINDNLFVVDNFCVSECNAGCCQPLAGLSGAKFEDLNGDGVWDNGEAGLPGWTINLLSGPSAPQSAVTDAQGDYSFMNLEPGTYTVAETPQAGWVQTAPAGGVYMVTLANGQVINNLNFGNTNYCTRPGINLDYATVVDAGILFADGGFTFVGNTNGFQFEIDDVADGVGDSIGFDGYISAGESFAIGAVTASGTVQSAPVTGNGTLHISDGVHEFTGIVQWNDITTIETSGVLNLSGNVNFTSFAYAGASQDLQALLASGTAQVDLTFQFIPGLTVTQLKSAGGFADFSGTIVGSPVQNTSPLIAGTTNKIVMCGSPWSFDPPTPLNACCTNLTIIPLHTFTNGTPCTPVISQVWKAYDCCSNWLICTQTVTVVDYYTPMICCASNLLEYSCTNIQVFYSLTAHDGCNSNLPVTCVPASGSSFAPGTTNMVYCTTTNCSGTTASAGFTVTVLWATNCACACVSNILVNGGFEQEPDWDSTVWMTWGDDYAKSLVGNALPGWTIETNHAVTIHRAGGTDLTISGNYTVNTDGEGRYSNNAVLYQDFNSTANQGYTLAFNWQSWGLDGDVAPQTQLKVSVLDTVTGVPLIGGLYSFDSPNPSTPGPLHLVTADFLGTGNQLQLRIEESPQSGTNDNMFVVDNFCVSLATNSCVPAPSGLVLWLPFDETNGSTCANLASPANYGTQMGDPIPLLGAYVSNSLSFNGTITQYVTVPDYPAIDVGTSDFTLDAWVNRGFDGPDTPPSVILDKRDAITGAGYSWSLYDGRQVMTLANSTSPSNYLQTAANVVPADGQWHFVAVSISQTARTMLFYVDGATNSTVPLTPADVSNHNVLWVGGSMYNDVNGKNEDQHWTGDLDEVEVYGRALSGSELDRLYLAGAAGKCKTNCACWTNCLQVLGPSDKTVPCGTTNWSFDAPTVLQDCCGNLRTNSATTTNGTFPVCYKRTWQFTDDCNNSATCTQTITVGDTNPPVIVSAPTNIPIPICSHVASPGTVIVDSDEWVDSDSGFANEGDGAVYIQNCAAWLAGGKGTNILISSSNFGLTGANLYNTLISAGYAVTKSQPNSNPLTPAYLAPFNAVFVGGNNLSQDELTALQQFICDGGGVYIAAGTGTITNTAGVSPSPAAEAEQWNALLNPFGLTLSTNYNNIQSMDLSVANSTLTVIPSPVMAGVSNIYYSLGNDVSVIGGDSAAQVVAFSGAHGLIGVSACTSQNATGCGTMPDATGQVLGTGTGTVNQSIPPGTAICANTSVIFTTTNSCGVATNMVVPVTLVGCTSNCITLNPTNIAVESCTFNYMQAAPTVVTFQVTAASLCCTNVKVACTPPSGYTFNPGCTTVTCVATDCCGNIATNQFTVRVYCPGPPIQMPAPSFNNGNLMLNWSNPAYWQGQVSTDLINWTTFTCPTSTFPMIINLQSNPAPWQFYRLINTNLNSN
jgi:autotransporter-associated beta strand protein